MTAKQQPPTKNPEEGARARRTAQRSATRARSRSTSRRSGISRGEMIGGALTVLIVIGILAYAFFRSQNHTASNAPGLTNPSALNPAPALRKVGTVAPTFTLKGVDGGRYSLAAQHGHPVLLEFFAVWCPVCQGEAPIMAKITKNYVPKGVTVWSILANPYGRNYEDSGGQDLRLANKSDLTWFAQKFNVHHPQLIDPNFKVVNKYGIGAYPGLYVVNSKGIVTFAYEGHQSYAILAKQLNKALGVAAK